MDLFDIPPIKRKQPRANDGKFCTAHEADVDRRYKIVLKTERANANLKGQVEYWRRQAEALSSLFIQMERLRLGGEQFTESFKAIKSNNYAQH